MTPWCIVSPCTSKVVHQPDGHVFRIAEILLVYDNGPDRSDVVIRALARKFDNVRPVWLMRNSGQHAATAAGIASSGSEWVVTLDEDGQHDPGQIERLVDTAIASGSYLVYGINEKTPHPAGATSRAGSARRSPGALAVPSWVGSRRFG